MFELGRYVLSCIGKAGKVFQGDGRRSEYYVSFDDLAEKRAEKRAEEARIEEKKAFARRLIARGKQTVEEIAEDADLPIEVVRDLAGLQLV